MSVPTKWQLAQHWCASSQRKVFAPMLEALDAPSCFACGWFSERWEKATPKSSWERALLERAHIVPASLGGSDDAANVILLCGPCHRESPDWYEPDCMARWIAERPERGSKELEELDDWCAAAQQVPQFRALLELVCMDSRMDAGGPETATQDMLGILRESARNASLHATSLSPGTKVAILRDATERSLAPFGAAACVTTRPLHPPAA